MKGVKFGNIHSYNDLELILAPFAIPPAIPKLNVLDIPGADGSLDLTEALGEVKFNDREFTMTFTVKPTSEMTFAEKVTQVSNLLNGRKFNLTLDRDSAYYWEGRCSVNEHLQDRNLKQIVIGATVRPYKLKQDMTEAPVTLSATPKAITLQNSRKTVVPEIDCTVAGAKITKGNATYTLEKGANRLLEIQLVEGSNNFTVEGSGVMTFKYREGVL